jgi:hypothetical protein
MAIVASIIVAGLTYFILMKLLFDSFGEFNAKLRSTILFFPVGSALDSVSKKESLRIWIWLVSGLTVGLLVHQYLS